MIAGRAALAASGCGHTRTKRRHVTVVIFGVTNSTCDDSIGLGCDRGAALGNMFHRDLVRRVMNGARQLLLRKENKASHETHMPPLARPGRAVGKPRPRGPLPRPLSASLRRYVLASSLRVWLKRRSWVGTRSGLPTIAGRRVSGGGPAGDQDVRYRASGNRQREYLAECGAVAQRNVRRIAAITAREYTDPQDLHLATLSSRLYVKSNTFKFVMT